MGFVRPKVHIVSDGVAHNTSVMLIGEDGQEVFDLARVCKKITWTVERHDLAMADVEIEPLALEMIHVSADVKAFLRSVAMSNESEG